MIYLLTILKQTIKLILKFIKIRESNFKRLNGGLITYGSLKAFDETIQIEGDSDIFSGISKYNVEFKD